MEQVTATNPEAAAPAAFEDRLEGIISIHKRGLNGDASAVKEADRLLEALRSDFPNRPIADAYHGSTMVLVARDKSRPFDKLKWSRNGLKLLDKAVAADPGNLTIRLLRGKAAFQLPEKYFQRTQTAIEDYTYLLNREGKQRFLGSRESLRMNYELGEAYRKIGRNADAIAVWKQMLDQTQDPQLQQLLQHRVRVLEGRPAVEEVQTVDPVSVIWGRAASATGNALINWVIRQETGTSKKKKRKKKRKKR